MKNRCHNVHACWPCQLPEDHPGPHRNSQFGMVLEWPRHLHPLMYIDGRFEVEG